MIDLLLLVVIGGSTVLGLLRGFVGTLVSTVAWLLSGWVAFRFGEHAAFWLSDDGVPSPAELMGGYAATFMAVMVAVTLVGMLIKSMVKSVGLSGVDRVLGMGLGRAARRLPGLPAGVVDGLHVHALRAVLEAIADPARCWFPVRNGCMDSCRTGLFPKPIRSTRPRQAIMAR